MLQSFCHILAGINSLELPYRSQFQRLHIDKLIKVRSNQVHAAA